MQRSMWRDKETTTKGWNRRTIPLTARLQRALERLAPAGRTYLVAHHETRPLTLEKTRWHLPRLCREAGIEPIGWHALRHTFCSHLAMMGAPPRTIQELAGHADLTTTLKYMHLVAGEKDRAIGLLEKRDERDAPDSTEGTQPHEYPETEGGDPSPDAPKPSQDPSQKRRSDDPEN